MASPFTEAQRYTPGFERRDGALYLFKVGETYRLYAKTGPAPQQALWRFEGQISRLRMLAESIVERNKGGRESRVDEGTHCVVFDSMPEVPPGTMSGITHRRRRRDPTIPGEPRGHVAQPRSVAHTEPEQAAPSPPKRKARRKAKGVSTAKTEAVSAAAEGPAQDESVTKPENSANGSDTSIGSRNP